MLVVVFGLFRNLRKKWSSLYKDWFYLNFDGDSTYQDGFWYEGWEGHLNSQTQFAKSCCCRLFVKLCKAMDRSV